MLDKFDIIIVGAGLVGLTTALACASKGARIAILDRVDPDSHMEAEFDGRASAIAAASFQMYRNLGITKALGDAVQPITDILITDGETGYATSPLILHFDSHDVDGSPMGYMMENRALRKALLQAVNSNSQINVFAPVMLSKIDQNTKSVEVRLETGKRIKADVIVAADGRQSYCRKQAGISVSLTPYNQKAIVTTVEHEKPHLNIAHELFLPSGPFAILPLPGNRSCIVWTDTPRAVDAAMALDDGAFTAELARRFGNFLGSVEPCAPRWAYPLSLQLAEQYVAGRLVLVGDAAHAIHPIAGQGLNMGLRDAAALADVVSEALMSGLDIGSHLETYARWRNFDNSALAASTDIFNRLFSNDIAPLKHARRLGLGLINRMKPARSFFIREASGRLGDLPTLLR